MSADIGSPWLPVQRIITSPGGSSIASCGFTIRPSGTSRYPSPRAMFRFLRIERPTIATFRPTWTATSIACCIRCTFDANETTRMRPRRSGIRVRNASPTSRSEPVMPGRSAFVESPKRRSTPSLPSSASRPTSVFWPSTGVWSSFQSPVWRTRPAAVSSTIDMASGIECATRTKSSRKEPTWIGLPISASRRLVALASPCSSSLDLTSPSVSLVAITSSQSTWRSR